MIFFVKSEAFSQFLRHSKSVSDVAVEGLEVSNVVINQNDTLLNISVLCEGLQSEIMKIITPSRQERHACTH